jgi:membrane-associated phospholipid phosphatase
MDIPSAYRRPMLLTPTGYGAAWAWASLLVMPAVLLFIELTLGLRPEHWALAALFVVLAWAGPRARRFSALGEPFVATGIAYDYLRLFIHLRGEVHVGDLHAAERLLFGVSTAGGRVALSDVIAGAVHPALDVVCGVAYILYLVQVFGVGAWLSRRHERRVSRLAWSFALASVIGWVVWIVWPAAPPWYVDIHGTGPAVLDAAPSAAGAARFDALFGIDLFGSFYARSSNVFGAMPSLHVGYALLPVLATWSMRSWPRRLTLAWLALMAFAAVYLRHHYILDVVAGLAVAFVADAVVCKAMRTLEERRRATPVSPARIPAEGIEEAA